MENTNDQTIIKNITACDPILADIIKDCYETIITRMEDGRLTFFEKGLKSHIETVVANGFEVRERQSQGIFDSIEKLLAKRNTNSWIKSEKELYNRIEGLLYLQLFGEDGEMTKMIGEYTKSIMQLDYSNTLPSFSIEGIKKNLFNYFGFSLESIAETFSESTISKKAIDAYFETQSDVILIVTDNNLKIRTVNDVAEKLFNLSQPELMGKVLFTLIPEFGAENFDFASQERIVNEPFKFRTNKLGIREVDFSFFSCSHEDEISEFVFVLDFKLKRNQTAISFHEDYSLLSNVIGGLHELRKGNSSEEAVESSTILLQNLYHLRESTKSKLLVSDQKTMFNEVVDFNLMLKHLYNEVRYIANLDKVNLTLLNKSVIPFSSNYELVFSIIKNLVINSIKFRDLEKSETQIEIKIEECEEQVLISISDNGIGIPQIKSDLIFDKGYTVNEQSDELGMGLYFVRRNVKFLAGTIEVQSELLEQTIFKILLPR